MSDNPRVSVQKHYDMLVANQTGGSEMAGQGTAADTIEDLKLRRRFRSNTVHNIGPGFMDRQGYGALNRNVETVAGTLARAQATFTVNDNDFSAGAELTIGKFTLVAGLDFFIAGSAAGTATNIANAVDNLPGYDGTAVGADVTVDGQKGSQGNADRFEAKSFGAVDNFTFVVPFAEASVGEPHLEGPEIT
jgi:hypothetical protein